jgi:hypothetical protein
MSLAKELGACAPFFVLLGTVNLKFMVPMTIQDMSTKPRSMRSILARSERRCERDSSGPREARLACDVS